MERENETKLEFGGCCHEIHWNVESLTVRCGEVLALFLYFVCFQCGVKGNQCKDLVDRQYRLMVLLMMLRASFNVCVSADDSVMVQSYTLMKLKKNCCLETSRGNCRLLAWHKVPEKTLPMLENGNSVQNVRCSIDKTAHGMKERSSVLFPIIKENGSKCNVVRKFMMFALMTRICEWRITKILI